MKFIYLGLLMAAILNVGLVWANLSGVFIPPELAYQLPQPYAGNISQNFIDTETSNSSANAIFAAARNATYYAFDQEFYSILGPSPSIRLVSPTSAPFAHEAGVWVPDHNQVWFTSDDTAPPQYYSILDLDTYTVTSPNNSLQHGPNPTGGDYYGGLVYFAALGNISTSSSPAVYSVDPVTFSTVTVLDTYFGVHLNSVDDLTWVAPNTSAGATSCTHANEANLFFTTLDLGANNEHGFNQAVLPNAVFRFTPATKSLQAVISRADVLAPNGIRSDPNGRYLYVTDTAPTALVGPGSNSSGSTAIYRFTLDADCNPTNKQLFAMPRSGIADGIHVDDYGRVWTAEYNGIVVRNARGKELGVFNAEQLVDPANSPIANFALAGDKLVVLSGDRIFVVQLGQNITTPAGSVSKKS